MIAVIIISLVVVVFLTVPICFGWMLWKMDWIERGEK